MRQESEAASTHRVQCPVCGYPNGPGVEECEDCGQPLPAPTASRLDPVERAETPGGMARGQTLMLIGVLGVVALAAISVWIVSLAGGDGTETITITIAQVRARPEAQLTYPRGLQVATEALTGTTTLQGQYAQGSCGIRHPHSCRQGITGYASTDVSGGTAGRLFTTDDDVARVLAWYTQYLVRRGWTAYPRRSESNPPLAVAPFRRGTGPQESDHPEEFAIYTGDPLLVKAFGGGLGRKAPVAHTVFSTVYTLYPPGTVIYSIQSP